MASFPDACGPQSAIEVSNEGDLSTTAIRSLTLYSVEVKGKTVHRILTMRPFYSN